MAVCIITGRQRDVKEGDALCERTRALADGGAARAHLARWMSTLPHARYYVRECTRWLDAPIADLCDILANHDSGNAEALRRTSPLVGILDARERWAIYQQFGQDRWAADAP